MQSSTWLQPCHPKALPLVRTSVTTLLHLPDFLHWKGTPFFLEWRETPFPMLLAVMVWNNIRILAMPTQLQAPPHHGYCKKLPLSLAETRIIVWEVKCSERAGCTDSEGPAGPWRVCSHRYGHLSHWTQKHSLPRRARPWDGWKMLVSDLAVRQELPHALTN